MKKPLILLLITIIICCTDLAIITSATSTLEFTSLNFSSSYSTVNPQFYHAQSSKDLEAFLNDLDSQAVLDITHSLIYSEIISKNAENQNFLHIKLESSYPTNGVNTFTASVLKSKEMLAANQLISTLNITSYGIVYLQHLKLEYEEIISSASVSLVLPPVYTSDYLKKLLNLYIRYSEVNTIVLLLPGDLAAQVLQVANLDFEDLGFVWILLPMANYLEYTQFTALESNGPILMQSDFDTLEIRLHNVYKGLEYCSDTTISLIRCFSELFRFGDDHYIEPFYSVLNTQNSTYVRVGDLSPDSCKITGYLKWSGGSKSEKVISIQQEAGLYSPTGAYLGFLAPAYNGAELAVDYLNNNNAILSGFMLKRNTYNFGALYYNRTFMNEAFTKAKDQLKTVMIAPAISDVTINLYNTLKNNSIALPMIGYANTVDSLTSSTVYPWFTRVNMASGYIGYLLGTIVKYFG